VLLITLDTTRADRLGSYGHAAASTPNLDRLAAGGVRFARALSPVPLTLPAHASLMTGRNPFRHGVRNNGHYALPTDVPTLAEQFRDAGYDTAAFVSSFVLDRQFGLARGFAVYDDTLDHASSTSAGAMTTLDVERRGDRTVAAATAWLRTRRPTGAAAAGAPGRPYFLWVHLYDAHDPYTPPPPYAERFAATPYDGELAFVDAQVGALLTAAGEASGAPPLVAVAGDHGESLGEHGESTHGLFVYDSAIRVPLILSWPGGLEPRVVEPTVRLVDLAPTLTALAGVPGAPAGVDGRDVTPLARGLAPPDTPATQDPAAYAAYAETLFPQFFMNWAPLRAIDDGRWKFVDAPEPELYDVAADPGESSNRYAAEPAVARRLKAQLEATLRAAEERSAPAPMSADAQRKLSALGYVAAPAAGSGSASAPRPDPKRMVARFQQLLDGNRALAANRPGEAVRLAREVLAVDPENAFARLVLGRGLLATGDAVGAATALMAYLAAVPGSADAHHWLALAYLRQDRRLKALDEEEAALALDPRHAAAASLRAGLLFSDGRVDDGIEALRAAVDGQPAHVGLRLDFPTRPRPSTGGCSASDPTMCGRWRASARCTRGRAASSRRSKRSRAHSTSTPATRRPGSSVPPCSAGWAAPPRRAPTCSASPAPRSGPTSAVRRRSSWRAGSPRRPGGQSPVPTAGACPPYLCGRCRRCAAAAARSGRRRPCRPGPSPD
jgi:arylsulfatase A-like enzyme